MRKMRILKDNRGSATVEITMLMPFILGILFLVIYLLLNIIDDGILYSTTDIYLENASLVWEAGQEAALKNQLEERLENRLLFADIKEITVKKENEQMIAAVYIETPIPVLGLFLPGSNPVYERHHVCIVEKKQCSDNLRRWQLFEKTI